MDTVSSTSSAPPPSKKKSSLPLLLAVLLAGTGGWLATNNPFVAPKEVYDISNPNNLQFVDEPTANVQVEENLLDLKFLRPNGSEVTLRQLADKKPLVLVFTRGWTGSVCPYCSTHTSGLMNKYQEFRDLGAEVVVVYPLEKLDDQFGHDKFMAATNTMVDSKRSANQPPFPIVLDVGLKAVDRLYLRKDLSKPASYIIDPEGNVQFAYVGANLSDRPSTKALLAQIEKLNHSLKN